MSGREYNKIAAAILLASLIGMVSGKIVDILYKPELEVSKRGYKVEVDEEQIAQSEQKSKKEEFEIDIETLMKTASSENGKQLFKRQCSSCHTYERGGANRVGPNLWNIVEKNKAANDNYNYSSALSNMGGKWTLDNLAHFLHNPAKYARGTKMSFRGIKREKDLADVIEFLRIQSN